MMAETRALEDTRDLPARALEAALAVARAHGVRSTDPEILAARSNLIIHLRPAPVVARVAGATAILRPDVREWFAREVAVAGFLVGQGARVVPPSGEIPPGPQEHDGLILSFWRFVQPDPGRQPSVAEAAAALQELHGALRDFPGELPVLTSPLVEVPRLLDRIERRGDLEASDAALLRDAYERLSPVLRSSARPAQALHGDAHLRNLIATAKGLLWNDFEDTCRSPAWTSSRPGWRRESSRARSGWRRCPRCSRTAAPAPKRCSPAGARKAGTWDDPCISWGTLLS